MIKTFTLSNGVNVVCEERKGAGKVSMQIYIKSGHASDSFDTHGLSNLMEKACTRGTATRTAAEIAEAVENKGGELSTSTGLMVTSFSANALARYAADTFDVLADVVRNPAFDAAEIEKAKTKIGQQLQQQDESPATKAGLKFQGAVFAGQPGGNNALGTADLLSSFTPAQVKEAHDRLLSNPSGIVISVAGDITAAEVGKLAEKYFGDLQATATHPKPVLAFTGDDVREATPHEQLNLIFGFKAPSKHDDDRYAMTMLRGLLSGGMSSPLFQEIREKRGLVYNVGAQYAPYDDTGVFRITAGTGKGNAGELIAVAFDLLGKSAREGFTDEEMAQTLESILRARKNGTETVYSAAARNGSQLVEQGRLTTDEEFAERLKKVTMDDVRRVCGEMLSQGLYALAAVGPQDTMPSPQDIQKMMADQLAGVTLPAKNPSVPSISAAFNAAAKKATVEAAPEITTLPNGIKVVTISRGGALSCGAWVGVGADNEPVEINGASHMNEHMMFKGTKSYGPGEIDRIVEGQLGGGLNAYTSHDKTCYFFYDLEPSALEKVVDICGEMIFFAKLDHEEFDGKTVVNADGTVTKGKGERDVVLEEIKRSNDNIGRRQWYLLNETAYPDQPHGRTVLGPSSVLQVLTAKELADYRDIFYVPNNTIFCAVGPVDHAEFVKHVEDKFGGLDAKAFPPLPVPQYKGGGVISESDQAKLCNVVIAAEAVPTTHADSLAYTALSMVLGDGKASRYHQEIVDTQQLSPSVGAGVSDFRNAGIFVVSSKTDAEKVRPLIASMYAILRDVSENLTVTELEKVKASMEMNVLGAFETNDGACDQYACLVQAYGRMRTPADISAEIDKLSVDDVKRIAKQVLASNPSSAIIAPTGTDRSLLPTEREIIALRDGKPPLKNNPSPGKRIG